MHVNKNAFMVSGISIQHTKNLQISPRETSHDWGSSLSSTDSHNKDHSEESTKKNTLKKSDHTIENWWIFHTTLSISDEMEPALRSGHVLFSVSRPILICSSFYYCYFQQDKQFKISLMMGRNINDCSKTSFAIQKNFL